jgi:hypothetical protein
MIDEAPESSLRNLLCQHATGRLSAEAQGWDHLTRPSVTISDSSWGTVLVQLRALGVITTGTKKRTVSDRSIYWRLTPAGDTYLVRLKAQKRTG